MLYLSMLLLIYGQTKAATERNEETMIIRLDEKVFTKQDVLDLGISVGILYA